MFAFEKTWTVSVHITWNLLTKSDKQLFHHPKCEETVFESFLHSTHYQLQILQLSGSSNPYNILNSRVENKALVLDIAYVI